MRLEAFDSRCDFLVWLECQYATRLELSKTVKPYALDGE